MAGWSELGQREKASQVRRDRSGTQGKATALYRCRQSRLLKGQRKKNPRRQKRTKCIKHVNKRVRSCPNIRRFLQEIKVRKVNRKETLKSLRDQRRNLLWSVFTCFTPQLKSLLYIKILLVQNERSPVSPQALHLFVHFSYFNLTFNIKAKI